MNKETGSKIGEFVAGLVWGAIDSTRGVTPQVVEKEQKPKNKKKRRPRLVGRPVSEIYNRNIVFQDGKKIGKYTKGKMNLEVIDDIVTRIL